MQHDHEFPQFKRVKEHVQKNQQFYIGLATGVALVYLKGYSSRKTEIVNVVAPMIAPVFNNTVNNGGHCCKVVQDIETGDLWPKIGTLAAELAEEHGLNPESVRVLLSKHLNGHMPHLFGKTYCTYAVATTG